MQPSSNAAGASGGARPGHRQTVDAASVSSLPLELRQHSDSELVDLEAVYRWLHDQPDLEFPAESRAVIRLWLEAIAAEQKRRDGYGLRFPTPSYGIREDLIERLKSRRPRDAHFRGRSAQTARPVIRWALPLSP